jgi:hypothetical protein
MKIKDKRSGELFYNCPVYVYRDSDFGYLIVTNNYKILFVTNNSGKTPKLKYTDVTNLFDIIEK